MLDILLNGTYGPKTLFGWNSVIGRKQYFCALAYQFAASMVGIWIASLSGLSGVAAVKWVFAGLAFAVAGGTWVMMFLAMRARLSDMGSVGWFIAVPAILGIVQFCAFVFADFDPAEEISWSTPRGAVFLTHVAMTAFMLMLCIAPPSRKKMAFVDADTSKAGQAEE